MSADLDANPHDHSLKMAFQENTGQLFVRADFTTPAPFHLKAAGSEDPKPQTFCEKTPHSKQDCFPKQKDSLCYWITKRTGTVPWETSF